MFRFRSKRDRQKTPDIFVYIRWWIATKLYMQIEYVHTIFESQTFSDPTSSFCARGHQNFVGDLPYCGFSSISNSFEITNAPNLKHLYRRGINRINFTKIEQRSRRRATGATKFASFAFLYFFGWNPQYGAIKVKFDTVWTFGPLSCA